MKLQIESPISRNITPACEARSSRSVSMIIIESQQTSIFGPLSHRAVVRARRRRRGFGGPLQTNQPNVATN